MGNKVNVYEAGELVGRVNYNSILDYFDGHNWTSGTTGRHLGITKLKSGAFVLIYGTNWDGERNTAEIVSDEEALKAILESNNEELLNDRKYERLSELQKETMQEEEEEEEEEK